MGDPRTRPRGSWRAIAACLLALVWLAPALPAAAQEPSEPELGEHIGQRVDALVEALRQTADTPLGLVALEELELLSPWFPYRRLAGPLEALLGDPATDPLVRAAVGYRLARAYLASGDLEASQAVIAGDGYLVRWSLVGPFENDGMEGFDRPFGPERERDPEAVYPGRAGPVGWRSVDELTRLGYLNVGQLAAPSRSSIAYAATTIDSPRARPARLWTTVDGAYKIWLNGELVARSDADLGGTSVREWWDVELSRGPNELVVKLAVESGPMGFAVRLTGRDGHPIEGVVQSAALVPSTVSLGAGTPPRGTFGSLLETFQRQLLDEVPELEGPAAEVYAGAALVLFNTQPRDASEPWRRFLIAGEACGDDASGLALLRCAHVFEHHWERVAALERAVERLDRDDALWPWAVYELASETYRGVNDRAIQQADALCDEVLANDPRFVPALVLKAQIQEDEGRAWRSRQILAEALALAPDSPEVVYENQWGLSRVGDTPELFASYRHLVELNGENPAAFRDLAEALILADQPAEARALLERARALHPMAVSLYLLEADLLINEGELGAVRDLIDQVLGRFPGSSMLWESVARLQVRLGDEAAADEAFAEALRLAPQDRDLQAYRAVFSQRADRFYEAYRLSLDEILDLPLPATAGGDGEVDERDYVYLLDQQITRVHGNGLGTRFVQQAYRVQTRQGANQLRELVVQYTPDDELVEILAARIIKADGTVQESFDQWEESLSQPWYGLYYDLRALVIGFEDLAPGDVLEVEYTVSGISSENMFDTYFGELWFVQDHQPKSLARYGVIHPAALELTAREPELPHEVRRTEEDGVVHEIFELHDVPRVEIESGMPGFSSVADYIHVSTFESWGDVSDWYWNLIEDQLVAGPEIESTVAELVEGLTEPIDRVRAIHEYVVRNTRYVGLEFGIHGFRPYRTTSVFDRRFGDCKDTASLMKVMLGVAGIESYVVLVRTRDLGNIEPAPASLAIFNHAITYVPELDLFMDGTAGHSGLEELPAADQGASALVVMDGEGYRFLEIPFLPAEASRLVYRLEVDLGREDHRTQAEIRASGQFAPPFRLYYEAEEQRLEDFQRDFGTDYTGAQIESLDFEGLEDITRPVEIHFEFTGARFTEASGDRLLLKPLGRDSSLARRLAGTATRRQPLLIDYPFVTVYDMVYQLPAGYAVGPHPEEWSEASRFGHFEMTVGEDAALGQLHVQVELVIEATRVEPADYADFRAFILAVEEAVNTHIELRRNDG